MRFPQTFPISPNTPSPSLQIYSSPQHIPPSEYRHICRYTHMGLSISIYEGYVYTHIHTHIDLSSAYPNFNMLKRTEISVSLLYPVSPALGKLSSLKKALNEFLLDKWIISPSLQLDCKCLKRQKPCPFSSLYLQCFARHLGHCECSQEIGGVRNGQSHTPMSQAAV